ncbi:MAG: GntR family transcriptional regulator [Leptolyngbyaceae cyanobacterium bins.59]|nr:GntR family transcriptional regulator [Leptolyngbyaceae cyanobacterium bins.59]
MDSSGPIRDSSPLHLVISEELRGQILNGDYAPGEQLPSEHQLMQQFQVSRITVRRAIANLVNQGLATSRRGKGVFVKSQQKAIYTLTNPLTFLEEDISRQGVSFAIQNLTLEPIAAPTTVQQILQLPSEQAEVYFQKKLLLLDGVPAAVDSSYLVAELGQACATNLKRRMTFPTLEQHGVAIERIAATLECTHASHELGEHLHVAMGSPIMVYSYTAYTLHHQPIVWGQTASRADCLSYAVVLNRTPGE